MLDRCQILWEYLESRVIMTMDIEYSMSRMSQRHLHITLWWKKISFKKFILSVVSPRDNLGLLQDQCLGTSKMVCIKQFT